MNDRGRITRFRCQDILMRNKRFYIIAFASVIVTLSCSVRSPVLAQRSSSSALTGRVSSKEEGLMEGVLVSAKRTGGTVTVTVVSDKSGRYRFPRNRLEPGQYSLQIRAVGYDLDNPGTVEIKAQKTTTVNLTLHKTADLASQLSNAEWLESIPGTKQQKESLLDCTNCHTLERIVKSKYNANEFIKVIMRMSNYSPGSSPRFPQMRVPSPGRKQNLESFRKLAEYLSSINLSSTSKWRYPLKTLPRLKGRSTHVIITEYDLPRSLSQPHDVVLDSSGMVWYGDFGQQYIGELNPKTAKVKEYQIPLLKPGSPLGNLDLEFDKHGDLWVGLMLQGGIAKFDPKTEKFQMFSLPPNVNNNLAQVAMVMPLHSDVDGKIWMNNVGLRAIHRMDLRSEKFETFEPYKNMTGSHTVYGIAADRQNNLYFLDFRNTNVGEINAKTGKITLYPTPTPYSRPRRGHMDSQGRLWFAEYNASKFAMFNTRTHQFREWTIPTPWSAPYDIVLDKNGEAWGGGMSTDRVARLNIKTGHFTEYQLPHETNIRRVFVDNSTSPVTFWVGNDHSPTVIKVEPLD